MSPNSHTPPASQKKIFYLGMSTVFFGTLICHARGHLNEVPTLLVRAQGHFMTERSLDAAIRELATATSLLERAKQAYESQASSSPSHQSANSSSSRACASSSLS
jgi:hypothetical protein